MDKEYYFDDNGNMFSPPAPPKWETVNHKRVWLNILLFLATILTTMMMGASLIGYGIDVIFENPFQILHGWEYSFAVLFILTCHEFGHYFAARWHKLNVTLPFYIPLPIPGAFHFGTMGAFIRLKSPLPNRRALMDVAVAGPLAGFVVSLGFLFYGYATLPDLTGIIAHVETIHPWPTTAEEQAFALTLGESLLFSFFNNVMGGGILPMSEVYHFPFIFAGWVGLLVTALNLLPIGQLDGGHIVYALLGKRASIASRLAFLGLIGLSVFLLLDRGPLGTMWLPWLIILSLIGLRHPPTYNDMMELTPGRRFSGQVCILIFFICFTPLPIYF
jgi:membrane-associated protease RseP (regulator of RpoE activity)